MPLAWLCAQDSARRLLAHSQAPWPQASFEYRAPHDVLALTLLFTCPLEVLLAFSPGGFDAAHALVTDDVEWAVWCQGRLDVGDVSPADRELAARTFRWLAASRLLGGSLDEARGICTATGTCRGAGVSVGVTLARRALGSWAHKRSPGPGPNAA
ncbi:hypothetical protein AB0H69_43550 [Streptomyces phaeochromogenes]|uniref:hypothetical protein n=1 Tax=Streptomyces phaeochromogenes TaxID=1923 RepID=UPI0033D4E133